MQRPVRSEILRMRFCGLDNIFLSLSFIMKTRYSSSLSILKSKIAQKITEAPPYFNFGKRRTTILHTKLRHNSVLNIDLCWCDLISIALSVFVERQKTLIISLFQVHSIPRSGRTFFLIFSELIKSLFLILTFYSEGQHTQC